jgi:hypothetical protein
MSEAINKAIVRRSWEEAWNTGNLAPIDERVDANDVLHPFIQGDVLTRSCNRCRSANG